MVRQPTAMGGAPKCAEVRSLRSCDTVEARNEVNYSLVEANLSGGELHTGRNGGNGGELQFRAQTKGEKGASGGERSKEGGG